MPRRASHARSPEHDSQGRRVVLQSPHDEVRYVPRVPVLALQQGGSNDPPESGHRQRRQAYWSEA